MSGWLLAAVSSGVAAFIATNIDDLVILTVLFSQTRRFHKRHIIAGQYLGFAALVLASLPGFIGGLFIPRAWIGLLGLVPIAIGIHQWFNWEEESEAEGALETTQSSTARVKSVSGARWRAIAHLLHPQTYTVAAITFANGGDNIGIYVPLFASTNPASLGVILLTFFVLVGVWCLLAYNLTRHPAIPALLTRFGHILVPLVFIGLGIYILLENGTLGWIGIVSRDLGSFGAISGGGIR